MVLPSIIRPLSSEICSTSLNGVHAARLRVLNLRLAQVDLHVLLIAQGQESAQVSKLLTVVRTGVHDFGFRQVDGQVGRHIQVWQRFRVVKNDICKSSTGHGVAFTLPN